MQVFCCCGPRRKGEHDNDEAGEASPSLPHSNALGLVDTPPNTHQEHGLANIQPPTNTARPSSQISPGEGPADICQLGDRGNSDDYDDDNGDEDASQSAQRSTKTLDAVRTKLIRHISQENETRRNSRVAVGHSEEELARRAELRRFRQKRIQDELEASGSMDGGSSRSHWSTRYLSPLIDLGLPGGGPRDTIEFTVDGDVAFANHPVPAPSSPLETTRRQASCPQLVPDDDKAAASSQCHQGCSLEPDSATAAVPSPSRPVTAQSMTTQTPAALGVNAPRLERVLGADNDFDIRHGSHAWDDQSALGIWLIAQGMRSRDTSLIGVGDGGSDATPDCDNMHSPSQDFGGIDRVFDTPPSVSRENSTTTAPRLHGHGVITDALLHHEADVDTSQAGGANQITSPPSVAATMSTSIANPAGRSRDNPSSNYPSVMPSFEPSPADSTANSLSLSPQDMETLELSPFQWQGDFSIFREIGRSEGQSSYATAEDDTSNIENKYGVLTNLPRSPKATLSRPSGTASDSTSLHRRELHGKLGYHTKAEKHDTNQEADIVPGS
ncbi:glutathione-dependent formaldehyde-activating enzyme [Purpureocillium lavendulum]|uniref:Glutathione-dependent formaldehyde-activating enzyme n=1 Tax=Purpureocillium lavendulum TaxID=1247861 RepID=A0AB34FRQ0_9HYPO|nr:glutathione-dependent formaldehyde-activating enzyme [Purpureocillium lavendulum]